MARDIETLTLQMSADLRKFEREMGKMAAVSQKRISQVEAQARAGQKNLSRIMERAGSDMVSSFRSGLGGLAPTLAAAFSAQQVIQYADAYTGLQNRLKATGLAGEELKRVEESLYDTANRNGVAVAATAELYQRASMARENLGASEQDLLKIVSGTSAALKLQGTSATEASGALLQLGQLLGGNKVQAQEYNSLIDQLPVVLEAVAKGSDRWGGSVNKLTKDVKDGKVTVQEWAAAMLKGFGDIEARASKSTTTVSASLVTLNNELGRYIGQTDSGLSATQRMAQGIEALSRNLDVVVTAGGVLVTLVGGRMVIAHVAAATATATHTAAQISLLAALSGTSRAALAGTLAMRGLGAASLFFVTNPIGIAITAVAVAIGLVALKSREASGAMKDIKTTGGNAAAALDAYEDAARRAANASGQAKKQALEHAAAMRLDALETVRNAKAQLELARARVEIAAVEQKKTGNFLNSSAGAMLGTGPYGGLGAAGVVNARQAAVDRALDEQVEAGIVFATAANRLDQIAADIANGAYVEVPTVDLGHTKQTNTRGASGPTPEELAAQRKMLTLQAQMGLLQAQGREDEARAIQRQMDLINLTKQYTDAQVVDAATSAKNYLDALHEAEDVGHQLDKDREARLKQIEREQETNQLVNDQLMDQLGYQAELARARGDETGIKNAERRLFIEQRTLEILRLKLATSETEARAMATGEYGSLDRAEEARDTAQTIVSVLRSDNIWEEAGRRFKDAAWNGVEDMLTQVIGALTKGGSGGGLGGLMSHGSGNEWWKTALSFLSGAKAVGGGVVRGQNYLVGERGPEILQAPFTGNIIPNVNQAMSRMQSGQAAGRDLRVTVDVTGANGDEAIRQIAYDAAIKGTMVAVQTSRSDLHHAQRQASRRFARS